MIAPVAILLFVTAQRIGELIHSRRNTKRLLARGGAETGAGHYPLIVLLHASWLAGLWLLASDRTPHWGWLAVYAALQALRVWTLASLGSRWTTRIIIVPGEPLVRRGPYRFLSHPNYVVVVGEIAVLPLVFGLSTYALVFSILNALVLWIRIRHENRALAEGSGRA